MSPYWRAMVTPNSSGSNGNRFGNIWPIAASTRLMSGPGGRTGCAIVLLSGALGGPAGDADADRRQDAPDRITQHDVGEIVERRRLGVDDHETGTRLLRERHEPGRRKDLQARADGEQQVTAFGGPRRTLDHLWHQRLAERNR